jgi:hypothetical protein
MKWFQFVSKIKKETGVKSLKEAMKIASERKSEWKKDGAASSKKTGKRKGSAKKGRGKRTRRIRGGRKSDDDAEIDVDSKMTGGRKSETDADTETDYESKMSGGSNSAKESKKYGGSKSETDEVLKVVSKLKW